MGRKTTPDILNQIMGSKPIKEENHKAIKVTFNITESLVETLEDVWMELRKKLKNQGRITKSLIVEKALLQALREYQEVDTESALFKDLLD